MSNLTRHILSLEDKFEAKKKAESTNLQNQEVELRYLLDQLHERGWDKPKARLEWLLKRNLWEFNQCSNSPTLFGAYMVGTFIAAIFSVCAVVGTACFAMFEGGSWLLPLYWSLGINPFLLGLIVDALADRQNKVIKDQIRVLDQLCWEPKKELSASDEAMA